MSDEAAAEAPEVPAHCVSAHGSTNAELLGLIRQGNTELRAHMQTDLEKLITTRLATHQAELEKKFEAKLIEMQNSQHKDQATLVLASTFLNLAAMMDTVTFPGRPGLLSEVLANATALLTLFRLLA